MAHLSYEVNVTDLSRNVRQVTGRVLNTETGETVVDLNTKVVTASDAEAVTWAEDVFLVDLRRNNQRDLSELALPVDVVPEPPPAEPEPEPTSEGM